MTSKAKRTLREERYQGELAGQAFALAKKAGREASLHTILPAAVRRTSEYKKLSEKRQMYVDGYCAGVADGATLAGPAPALSSADSGVHAISTNPPPAERPHARRRSAPPPAVPAPAVAAISPESPFTPEELETVGAALLSLMRARRAG